MKPRCVFILIVLLSIWVTAVAQDTNVPPLINYQGRLTDSEGKGMTGTKRLEFNLYDAATGGKQDLGTSNL